VEERDVGGERRECNKVQELQSSREFERAQDKRSYRGLKRTLNEKAMPQKKTRLSSRHRQANWWREKNRTPTLEEGSKNTRARRGDQDDTDAERAGE
jgi:hypothetical protein